MPSAGSDASLQEETCPIVENSVPESRPRGRPRDHTLEERVFSAAVALYAEAGWDGFNFENIAKRAGVGKAALYSRWGGKEKLFTAAFEDRWQTLAHIDTGSFSGDLEELIAVTLERFMQSQGGIVLNMQADGRRSEEFRKVAQPFYAASLKRITRIFERGIERGELPRTLDSGIASLMVHGTITAKLSRQQMTGKPLTTRQKNAFAKTLVAMIGRAVS